MSNKSQTNSQSQMPSLPTSVSAKKIAINNTHDFTTTADIKCWIKETAQSLGFADCGFLSVHHPLFVKQTEQLKQWLAKGYEAQLQFMHSNHHLRAHPEQLVEGA